MKANQIVVAGISFVFGGLVSFVLFGRPAEDGSQPEVRRLVETSETGEQSSSKPSRRTGAPRPALANEAPKPEGDQIDRESLRRFLAIDPEDLGDAEELLEWGISEEDAIEVSAAYTDTVEAVRRMEARLATVETDKDGNEYVLVPPHLEESKRLLAAMEKRLQPAFPGGGASVLTEIVSAEIFGVGRYRSDELQRMIFLTDEPNGGVSYHDRLIGAGGEELVSQVYVGAPGDETIPVPLAHLFKDAQWSNSNPQPHDSP